MDQAVADGVGDRRIADVVVPVVDGELVRHRDTFGTAPTLYAADRGFYSLHNIAALAAAGVTVESVPQRGHKTPVAPLTS